MKEIVKNFVTALQEGGATYDDFVDDEGSYTEYYDNVLGEMREEIEAQIGSITEDEFRMAIECFNDNFFE